MESIDIEHGDFYIKLIWSYTPQKKGHVGTSMVDVRAFNTLGEGVSFGDTLEDALVFIKNLTDNKTKSIHYLDLTNSYNLCKHTSDCNSHSLFWITILHYDSNDLDKNINIGKTNLLSEKDFMHM